MTREIKLEAIYKEIANKELTFGCRIKIKSFHNIFGEKFRPGEEIVEYAEDGYIRLIGFEKAIDDTHEEFEKLFKDIKIIGHKVMIGDVLDYLWVEEGTIKDYKTQMMMIDNIYRYKREPIEEQIEECIDYIYNLLNNGT